MPLPSILALTLASIASSTDAPVPFFNGLGSFHRAITTKSLVAQRYFDQGMAFVFGFNHDEAIKAFRAAAKADPNCPMAYWAIANAYGPNINYPMVDPVHAAGAWDALTKAKAIASKGSAVEQALIAAQSKRFANPQPEDRSGLDKAYAEAMREVWKKYPKDPEVGALFAESLMDLRPWDLWTLDGKPVDITPEILRTIDSVLKLNPKHPQGLHLKIHALEASPNPVKALDAANKLRDLQPALGHMVHMPSHIDIRVGHWVDAETSNAKAITADTAYRKAVGKLDFYRGYITHNYHMLTFAAMMRGEGQRAINTMDEGVRIIPTDWAKTYAAFIDAFMVMPVSVRVRFGRWNEVLSAPDYPEHFPISRALRHGARAVAYAATGHVAEAWREQAAFEKMRKATPATASWGNNTAGLIFTIESHFISGEILLAEKNLDASIEELRSAVVAEDQVKYNEPPDWIQPTRHTLGAVLVQAHRYKEAVDVYKRDLIDHPENGWALKGLALAYAGLGDKHSLQDYQSRFDKAWKDADLKIGSSCLCVKG